VKVPKENLVRMGAKQVKNETCKRRGRGNRKGGDLVKGWAVLSSRAKSPKSSRIKAKKEQEGEREKKSWETELTRGIL